MPHKRGEKRTRWAAAAAAAIALTLPASVAAQIKPDLHFGSNGSEAGEFQIPVSIEVGPNGDIYAGDAGTNRVSQFASDGTFIRAWGFDVDPAGGMGFEKCTTVTGCQNGSQNGGAGEMQSADGIAAASNGDLYVTEFSDHRVSQFTASGDFVRAWGWGVDTGTSVFETCTTASGCQTGLPGSGLGQMTSPNSVAVSSGEVYITDVSEARVNRFTTAGVPIGSFGSFGSGAGQLNGPRGVAISPNGNVLVVDRANNRVSEFTESGAFVRAWGVGVDTGSSEFETCTTASGCQAGVPGAAAGEFSDGDGGEGVMGIGVNAPGDIFLGDDGNNRVAQYAPTLGFTRAWGFDVAPPDDPVNVFEECTTVTGCQQAAADFGLGGLANPADLSVDSLGRVLVVDFQADRVVRYADPVTPSPDPGPGGPPSDPSDPVVDPPDTKAPTVKITAKPKAKVKTKKRKARFSIAFNVDEAATFTCSRDDKPPNACTSPFTGKVKKGKHEVEVIATDAAGNKSNPAVASWKVKRKKRR
jgi:hypothetical protein